MLHIVKLLGKRCKFRLRKLCIEFLILFTLNTFSCRAKVKKARRLLFFSIKYAIKQSLSDNDVTDVGKMFMMMLLGGNSENMEALRGDEDVSAGKEPLFPEAEKDENLSHALKSMRETKN